MACAKSELCIFDRPSPQVVVENYNFEEIYPINTISGKNDNDIEFKINASNIDYLDLNDTVLIVNVKVVGTDGKDLDEKADVVPSNYLMYTLFKDAVVTLNNTKIEGGNNVYAHKALFDTILNYSSDTKATILRSIGYSTDETFRKQWIAKSKVLTLCGPLRLDFFDQPKYLIPGVNVHLRLQRSRTGMSLKYTNTKARLEIQNAKLLVRRVKVEPSVLIAHELGLEKHNAVYPFRRTELVSYSLPKGTLNFYKDQIFGDMRLPKFVLLAFQSTAQYNGNVSEDCVAFQHCNVSSITLSRNTEFRENYTMDFETSDPILPYVQSIIRNFGNLNLNTNSGINFKQFKEKYPFFTFNLCPDFNMNQAQMPKQGNLRLDIKFGKALEKATSVIIYGIFDDEIQINKNRTIIVE